MAKIPLVLIPGLMCTRALFAQQIAGLADLAEISVADHSTADSMAGIGKAILAAAPEPFALAGLSMGGAIALEIMRQAPGRVWKLALLDTNAGLDSAAITAARRGFIEMARQGRFMAITLDHLLPRLIHPARLADKALVETVLRMAEDTGAEVFIRQETALIDRPDSLPSLGAIRCPSLVVVGAEDILTPPERAKEIAGGIPGARLEIVPDCAHLSTLEQPAGVTRLLRDWLLW